MEKKQIKIVIAVIVILGANIIVGGLPWIGTLIWTLVTENILSLSIMLILSIIYFASKKRG